MTSGEIVFVAMDVGGSGGMERHAERLVERLLDAGRAVTVVARTCALDPRAGLRFVRVPVPRRPAVLAYPAFFAVASLLVAQRGSALLHTTGAIVANPADVSTVHYCHRAAVTRVGSRASRPSALYRLNSAVLRVLAQAGEVWCYRPARTRRLCAVSRGVAGELRDGFPTMASAVLTIPNGVDSDLFRPDPAARREVRSELGISDQVPLALFVGGDWERKGLRYAVDALALASQWHLAVAGPGDAASLAAQADSAGTGSRLRFLGAVRDMPRLYAAADAFVLPTAYEAFPLVSLEAAASGLPLLITRVNGADELVQHGHNGWFVSRNAVEIAQRLIELSAHPGRARAMAQAARAAACRYTWDGMADRYLTLYADLANGR